MTKEYSNQYNLPAELLEAVAEKIHDAWAEARLSEGWTFGETRNDDLKTHPCLVPYSDLPDIEKDYDRRTALTTLNALAELGYELVKT